MSENGINLTIRRETHKRLGKYVLDKHGRTHGYMADTASDLLEFALEIKEKEEAKDNLPSNNESLAKTEEEALA